MNIKNKRSLMSKLRGFDMFGDQIIFTFNGSSHVRTYAGLFLTILLITIFIVMFIFMGQSFFFRINPIASSSLTQTTTPFLISTTQRNQMFLAYKVRASTLDSSVIPFDSDRLYTELYIFTPNKPATANIVYPRPCNKVYGIDRKVISSVDLNLLYCVDISALNFGGSPNSENYTYMELKIRVCSSSSCDQYANYLPSLYIDLYYPNALYDPNDPKGINVQHNLVTDTYKKYNAVVREITFQKLTLRDDVGWIFEDIRETVKFVAGTHNVKSHYKILPNDSSVSSIFLYMGNTSETNTRKYQKIQDVLAVTGGFVRVIQILMKFITLYFIRMERNTNLLNNILNFRNNDDYVVTKLNDSINYISKPKSQLAKYCSNSIYDVSRNASQIIMYDPNQSSTSLLKKEKKKILDVNIEMKSHLNVENRRNSLELANHGDDKNFKGPRKFKLKPILDRGYYFKLRTFETIKRILCPKRYITKQESHRIKLYELCEKYIEDKLDVKGYFEMSDELSKMKYAMFNHHQRVSMHYFDKPTIFMKEECVDEKNIDNIIHLLRNERDKENPQAEIEKLTGYFSEKINNRNLNDIDSILLFNMKDDLAVQILEKVKTLE